MKKHLFCWLGLCILMAWSPNLSAAKEGEQKPITIKMADHVPASNPCTTVLTNYFIKTVEESAKGRVKIEYFPASQLGKQPDMLNLANWGLADITLVCVPAVAGQTPLNTVMMMPEYATSREGTNIQRILLNKPLYQKEFKQYNVRPVFALAYQQYDCGTVKKPVQSLKDLKGLKMKTSGGLYNTIAKRVGVVPVVISVPETYEALQRGTVDGAFFNYTALESYHFDEVEKYHTYGASFGGYPLVWVMNEKKWNALPADIQKIITDVGLAASERLVAYNDTEQENIAKRVEKKGMTIYRLTPEEKKKWMQAYKGLEEEWISDMEKRGLPGKQVYDEFHKVCQEVIR